MATKPPGKDRMGMQSSTSQVKIIGFCAILDRNHFIIFYALYYKPVASSDHKIFLVRCLPMFALTTLATVLY